MHITKSYIIMKFTKPSNKKAYIMEDFKCKMHSYVIGMTERVRVR